MHSWIQALLGGALIGAAAALLLVTNGRIAGISGIVGGLFTASSSDRWWRVTFVLGLLASGLVVVQLFPTAFRASGLPLPYVGLAGVLVGVGTSLANGCTSGHGICGVSRLSKRSLVATSTFMLFGMVVAVVAQRLFSGGGGA
jgi:uncharacterized membrane protein YedE/YeeE